MTSSAHPGRPLAPDEAELVQALNLLAPDRRLEGKVELRQRLDRRQPRGPHRGLQPPVIAQADLGVEQAGDGLGDGHPAPIHLGEDRVHRLERPRQLQIGQHGPDVVPPVRGARHRTASLYTRNARCSTDIDHAIKERIFDNNYSLDFGRLHTFVAGDDPQKIKRAALFGSRPPPNDSLLYGRSPREPGSSQLLEDRNVANKEKRIDTGIVTMMMRDAYTRIDRANDVITLVAGDGMRATKSLGMRD